MEKRELEVYIGPFQEWQGKPFNEKQSLKLVSNGNNDSLYISVNISKGIISVRNTCTIQIYNLNENTRNALSRGLSVNVYAGNEGEAKELVYKGGITRALTTRAGPNLITTISCLTGQAGLLLSKVSKSYTEGVEVAKIVQDLASTIPGVTIDPNDIAVEGNIGPSGFVFIGSAQNAIDRLAKQYGFSWNIEDGKFIARRDGSYMPSNIILSENNGLRKVSPRTDGLFSFQKGVDIQAHYMPNISPWKSIKVKTALNKMLSGTYQCHQIDYALNPKGREWDMHIVDMLAYSRR